MPETEDLMLLKATQAYQLGRLPEAFRLCRATLEHFPQSAGTYNLLGHIACQTEPSRAEQMFVKAIKLAPGQLDYRCDLADFYRLANRYPESIKLLEPVIAVAPNHVKALNNYGAVLIDSGRAKDGIVPLKRASELEPNNISVLMNCARACMEGDAHEQAIEPLTKIISLAPTVIEAYPRLLDSYIRSGRLSDAENFYPSVIAAAPDPVAGALTVGHIARRAGYASIAVQAYNEAIRFGADDPNLIANLVECHKLMGDYTQAERLLRESIQKYPAVQAHVINLASVLSEQGSIDEAIKLYDQAKDEMHRNPAAFSNYLLHSQYVPGVTPDKLLAIHKEFDVDHGQPYHKFIKPHLNLPDPERKLRLGFVSADLEQGPVASLTYQCIKSLDPSQFEIFIYAGHLNSDDQTERYKSLGHWRVISNLVDQRVAEVIRSDQVDVLIDLSGHVANNRMTLFAHKPAPIQITWLGYEGTTGVSTIDYLIADPFMISPEEEGNYVEKVLRINEGYLNYSPNPIAPPINSAPCLKNGYVRFGSFSNACKFHDGLFANWAAILNSVHGSKLLLKYRGMDEVKIQQSIRERIKNAGGDPDRVEFEGWTNAGALFEAYQNIDIALDTFPFTGSATTCDALWMGVPVVTLKGQTFAGRHGYGHLSRLGLPELVAGSTEEYVKIATELARDPQRIESLRQKLRPLMAERLCDGSAWAKSFTQIIRQVWRDWCANHKKVT